MGSAENRHNQIARKLQQEMEFGLHEPSLRERHTRDQIWLLSQQLLAATLRPYVLPKTDMSHNEVRI